MNIVDDFNVHSENTVPSPRKKSHKTLWTLLLAAVIALACAHVVSGANSISVTNFLSAAELVCFIEKVY